MLEDLAVLTGGKLIAEELGLKLESLDLEDLGTAKRVVITKDNATIIDGAGESDAIEARMNQSGHKSKTPLQITTAKSFKSVSPIVWWCGFDSGGAATEIEMKERKARVEDALHATRAAVEEGILPGGGVASFVPVLCLIPCSWLTRSSSVSTS